MIFRLSQKLNSKIKAGTLPALPLDDNQFADWSAHLFVVDRTQYIIFSNTKSLYSNVMFAKGITSESQFIEQALSSIRDFMADDGLQFIYRSFIAPASGTVRFSKAVDRSVTGSMNELINEATYMLVESKMSPYDVSFKLNEILLSAISPSKALKFGVPREVFKAMVGSVE